MTSHQRQRQYVPQQNKPMKLNQSKLNSIKAPKNEDEMNADELGRYQALSATAKTEGGKILIEGLFADIVGTLDFMTTNVDDLTHPQLIGSVCKIKERLDIARSLLNAKTNFDILRAKLPETVIAESVKMWEEHEAMIDPNLDKDAGK